MNPPPRSIPTYSSGRMSTRAVNPVEGTNKIGQWCPVVDFFPTVEAAGRWSTGRDLDGRGVPLLDIAGMADRWRAIIEGR